MLPTAVACGSFDCAYKIVVVHYDLDSGPRGYCTASVADMPSINKLADAPHEEGPYRLLVDVVLSLGLNQDRWLGMCRPSNRMEVRKPLGA